MLSFTDIFIPVYQLLKLVFIVRPKECYLYLNHLSSSFVNSLMFQVDILEETTRYILSLEQKLLEKVRKHGLPEKFVKMNDNHVVSDDLSDNEDAKDNIDMHMMKCILHKFAQPEIERRLEDQKIEDEKQILEILETGR